MMTSAHPPLDARIFYKEACSLSKAGYEVVLIAPYPGKPAGASAAAGGDRTGHFPKEETVAGIRIRYVPPFQSRVRRIFNLKVIYQAALAEKADLYHFHDPDLIFTGLTLQKKLGKPVLYDVHEYYADSLKTRYWLPAPLRGTAAALFDRLEKNAARQFAGILTVNHHMEKLFRMYNPVGTCLFNFPLREQFQFERPAAGPDGGDLGSLGSSEGNEKPAPRILYLGGINKERGLEVILEAMPLVREKHPAALCQLVGPLDPGGLSPRFLPLEPWLARGNVQVLGKVPYSQVPGILQSAHIALVPLLPTLNYQKAIPVKLIEYMAAGLPVVGSRFGYIAAILNEENCGRLAEPGDPRSLAGEICALIENPGQALSYAQKGWDAFHGKYSWEREEEKLLAVYKQVLES